MADKKVRVQISFKQVVEYNIITEVSKEDYKIIKDFDFDKINTEDNGYEIIESYISEKNVFSADEEFTNVQVIKLKN